VAVLQRAAEEARALRVAREQHHPAGLAVEPVRGAEPRARQPFAQRCLEREALARARALHRQPGGLVRGDHASGVVEHDALVERHRLGLARQRVHRDVYPLFDRVGRRVRLDRVRVEPDPAVVEYAREARGVEPGPLAELAREVGPQRARRCDPARRAHRRIEAFRLR